MEVEISREKLSQSKRHLLLQQMRGIGGQKRNGPVLPRPAGIAVPLSTEQRRVWLHAAQHPELPLYNESVTIHRHGSFDLEILKASLNEILRRHEIWRTSFSPNGEPKIHGEVDVPLTLVDLSELLPAEREAEALRLATKNAHEPVPLDQPPLFRVCVVKMRTDEHRLYLTLHHIIFDGVSIGRIFLPELSAIYASFERGEPSPLLTPLLQYGDYALWREQQVNSPAVKQHLAYWFQQLSGELPALRLPVDRPQPAMATHRGSAERFHVPSELLEKLRTLCRAQNVTLYMLLLAIFKVLLFRYSGQNDLIVGSVSNGRRRPEFEPLMGYFLDTFAVRTRPAAELSFTEYLTQTRDAVLAALVAADAPFDQLVHKINPQRDPRHHPIFQAFFNMRPPGPFLEGWNLTTMDVIPETSKFALNLEVCEWPDSLEARFLYETDYREAATIRRMAAHWLVLLQSVCGNPETSIGDLAILTPEETASLLGVGSWNDTDADFPQAPLQFLIEDQVRRTPQAVAASFAGEDWTYEQLNSRANALASQLQSAAVKRGSIVAIALERSLEMLAGMFAVLKISAAYLPLDIDLPPERIALQFADAKPSALLTQYSISQRIHGENGPIVFVDSENNALPEFTRPADVGMERETALDNTAYVIYTSGTTGEPKAVEISQRSLVNLLTSMQRAPGFGSNDVLLAVTPISFDIAALELFLPLISGGKVFIASREEALDPCLLAEAICRSKCTVMQATPSTWRMLLLSGWNNAAQVSNGKSGGIKRLLCGGEALPRELGHRLLQTGADVWNMYGPTETTIWSTIHHVSAHVSAEENQISAVPVGYPIANTTAHILDTQRQLVPIGIPGELFLGGLGLAKGYLGRPQRTADRFVRIKSLADALMYRTGDLAVRKADGTIVVLGRTDNQVKVRGYRIELEAVEAAVLRHPQVAAAAARVWPDPTGDSRLSVYLVPHEGKTAPSPADLRDFLRQSIPNSMIPSDAIALPTLPLTTHGKVDRSRLPAPMVREGRKKPALHATPLSPIEARLCRIWADVLGVKEVGIDNNFFDLGGHSLLVALAQQRIASEFGQRIPIAELFHNPTVREQAELMLRHGHAEIALPPGVLSLQSLGTGTSIFWIHYLNPNLVREMKDDHPFFVVSLTAEDTAAAADAPSIESLAAQHVRKICATQPTGPYVIGGQCVGGVLAYEVAKQLTAAGKEVSLLVLLDVPNPSQAKPRNNISTWYRYLGYMARRTKKEGVRKNLRYVNELISNHISRALKTKSARTEMRITQEIIETAAKSYRTEDYNGSVLLVLSSEHAPQRDFLREWKEVVQQDLHVQYIDGHHRELDVKHAPDVATAIVRLISTSGEKSFTCSAGPAA